MQKREITVLPSRSNALVTSSEDELFYQRLEQIVRNSPNNCISKIVKATRNADLYGWILKKTPKLDSESFEYSLGTRIFWIIHGMEDFQVCRVCGRKLGVGQDVKISKQPRKYCSTKCMNADPEFAERCRKSLIEHFGCDVYAKSDAYKSLMLERYGIEYPFQSKEIREKALGTLLRNENDDPEYFKKRQVKSRESYLEHYGVDHNMKCEEGRKEWSDSYRERTGYDHNWKNPECRARCVETAKSTYGEDYLRHDAARETCIGKFGVPYYFQTDEFKEQARETSRKNWGTDFPSQAEPVKGKIRQSTFEHFGVYFSSQSPEVRRKIIATWLENLGVDNPLKSPEVREKIERTCMETRGVRFAVQDPEVRSKIVASFVESFGVDNPMKSPEVREKCSDTLMENYGVDNPTKSPVVRQRVVETFRRNYGVDNPMQCPEIRRKAQQRYTYSGVNFDSKPEIAYFIWLTDTLEDFEYQPDCNIFFEYKGKMHRYYPDFRVGGRLVEIKGDHMMSESGEWICPWDRSKDGFYEAKHQCALASGVEILTSKDYQKYLDYVGSKYGKSYLDGFKNRHPTV